MTTSKTLTLVVGLACCGVPSAGLAQSAPAEGGEQVSQLDEIVVQGVRRDPRRDGTSSRIVVDQEELTRYGDTSLTEAMKRLPGVSVGQGEPGRAGGVSLRGMGEGYTQILIDGQKAPAGFNIESLTPEMVARIEILRSPTADVRAEGAAGSINIVLLRGQERESASASLAWGSTNARNTIDASWRGTRQVEDITRALAINLRRREVRADDASVWRSGSSPGTTDSLRTRVVGVDAVRHTLTLAPSLQADLANGDRLGFLGLVDISRLERSAHEDWNTLLGAPLDRTALRQAWIIDQFKLNTALDWLHAFQDGALLTSKVSLGGSRETYGFREQGYDGAGQQSLDDHTRARIRAVGFTVTSKYALPQAGSHSYEIGWEAALDRRRDSRIQELRSVGAIPGSVSALDFDVDIRRVAIYGQDEIRLNAGWSAYFGLRWEGVETLSDSVALPNIRRRASLLSPTFHSVWKLPGDSRRQVRLAINQTYKLPPVSSLTPRPYTSSNNGPLTPDEQGNPDLRPERAVGLDLAFEQYWDKGAQISLGGFVREIGDVVRTETRFLNDRWVASPINGGSATVWGLEADTRFGLSQVLPRAPNVAVRFNGTYSGSSVADVIGPDNRIAGQAPFSATVAGDYVFRQGWTVGASYGFRSASTIQVTPIQRETLSATHDLEVYSLWSLGQRASLRLSGSSLTARDAVSSVWRTDATERQGVEKRSTNAPTFRVQFELDL